MNEDNKNVEQVDIDEIKQLANDVIEKTRTQAMLLGGRSMAIVVANMIDEAMRQPGKRTMNDMRRIVKKVRDFCQVAIDHEVEAPKFGEDADEA